MMERRGFLKGLFGGITSAGLIVTATPAEIEAFAQPLKKDEPIDLRRQAPVGVVSPGETLYNALGEQVAVITGIDISTPHVDITSYLGDQREFFIAGPRHIKIHADGICSIDFQGDKFELRGRRS